MKLVSHEKNKTNLKHDIWLFKIVLNPDLMTLCDISYDYAYKGLILTLFEKWHRETNSFHVLVGEMTLIPKIGLPFNLKEHLHFLVLYMLD